MRTIVKLILRILGNAAALLVAHAIIPGVELATDPGTLITLGAILAALNLVLRPLLKLFLGPLIILTFGLFLFVVHAIILAILDFISPNLTLEGYVALAATTLLVGAMNLVGAGIGSALTGNPRHHAT